MLPLLEPDLQRDIAQLLTEGFRIAQERCGREQNCWPPPPAGALVGVARADTTPADRAYVESTRRPGATMKTACPHCGVVLAPPPKANRKCPECRERLVVRTRDSDKLLFTPAGADDYDR